MYTERVIQIRYCFYRSDRVKNIQTKLKLRKIDSMGWCNDPLSKKYNSLIKISKKLRHEKLYRKDNKYDVIIVIGYNIKKPNTF